MKDWREFSIRDEFEARQMAWAAAVREDAYRAGQEMSGAAVPWMARYFPELANGGIAYHRRKRADRDADVSAMLAAQDLRRFWDATMATLGDVERRADDLIVAVERELAQAEQALTDIQSRAETLDDGTRIYPDRDGIWRAEDGSVIDLEAAGRPQDALRAMPGIARPTWEEFTAARDRRDGLAELYLRTQSVVAGLGETRHSMHEALETGDIEAVQDATDQIGKLENELDKIQTDFTRGATNAVLNAQAPDIRTSDVDVDLFKPLVLSMNN